MNLLRKYKLEDFRNLPINYPCPHCANEKTYQRYVYIKSGIQVANDVGSCNSKKGCGYNYVPFTYFKENNLHTTENLQPSFIPNGIFTRSLNNHEENSLFIYLEKLFGNCEATKAIKRYSIGTGSSKICPGSAVLWRIDKEGKIRTGRIVVINNTSGKEESSTWDSKGWVHRALKVERFNAVECLFGENLLSAELNKPVVVVENEKRAIIASCVYPNYLWLALCNGFNVPNREMLLKLSGRSVTWFSSSGFDKLSI